MIIVCCVVVNNRALFLAWQGGYIKPSAHAVIYTDMDFNYLSWVKWFLKFVLHVMIRCMYLQVEWAMYYIEILIFIIELCFTIPRKHNGY